MCPEVEEYGAFFETKLVYALYPDFYLNEKTEFVICGLCGDYCVLETLKNVIALCAGTDRISVYLNGIESIDGGTKLNNFIFDNHIKIYDPE
jgi:nicotinamidase-related amidase